MFHGFFLVPRFHSVLLGISDVFLRKGNHKNPIAVFRQPLLLGMYRYIGKIAF